MVTDLAHAGFGAFSQHFRRAKCARESRAPGRSGCVAPRVRLRNEVSPAKRRQYSGARRELARSLVEIEKQVAGRSASVHELKRRLLDAPLSAGEFQQLSAAIPREEWPIASELSRLVQTHSELMARAHKQQRFTRLLQRWRVLHVPSCCRAGAPPAAVMLRTSPARLVGPLDPG